MSKNDPVNSTRFPPHVEAATYTADELAILLNVSVRHVWRLRDLNQLPASIRLGKLVRWPRKLVNEWLALQHEGAGRG